MFKFKLKTAVKNGEVDESKNIKKNGNCDIWPKLPKLFSAKTEY